MDAARIVPIAPESSTFHYHRVHGTRIQLPLRLAYALTVHKSQGATLPAVHLTLSALTVQRTPALAFVGLSRVRRIEDLLVHPIPMYALTTGRSSPSTRVRLAAELSLARLAAATVEAFSSTPGSTLFDTHSILAATQREIDALTQLLAAPV